MTKKLMITCFFGDLPPWIEHYQPPKGYDFLLVTDLEDFNRRVKEKLEIDSPIQPGTGKPWDFRPALGILYEEELQGYDFWGHTDLDCVYGNVEKWVTEEFLADLDVHSNHNTYVCGCWSLFRNIPQVNNLFRQCDWKRYMLDPKPNGWVEGEFSRSLEKSGLRYRYTFWQGNPWADVLRLEQREDGTLLQDGTEIMMFHFRRTKRWPL